MGTKSIAQPQALSRNLMNCSYLYQVVRIYTHADTHILIHICVYMYVCILFFFLRLQQLCYLKVLSQYSNQYSGRQKGKSKGLPRPASINICGKFFNTFLFLYTRMHACTHTQVYIRCLILLMHFAICFLNSTTCPGACKEDTMISFRGELENPGLRELCTLSQGQSFCY